MLRTTVEKLPDTCIVNILSYLVSASQFFDVLHLLLVDKEWHVLLRLFITRDLFQHLSLPVLSIDDVDSIFTQTSEVDSPLSYSAWCQHSELLTPRSYYIYHSPKILIVGGSLDNRKCELFHPWSGKFHRVCSLAIKRSDEFDLVCYRGHALAISGCDDSSLGVIEFLNLRENNWHLLSKLPDSIAAMAAVVSGNGSSSILRVIGGTPRRDGMASRSAKIYRLKHSSLLDIRVLLGDTKNEIHELDGNWEEEEVTLLKGRSHHSVCFFKGRIWIAGGFIENNSMVTATVEILEQSNYDDTARVVQGPSMSVPRCQPKLVVCESNLFAVGGDMQGSAHAKISTIERFDEKSNSWEMETEFPDPIRRQRCAAVACQSRIFVFGGSDGSTTHTSWDFYSIPRRAWGSQLKRKLVEGNIGCLDLSLREQHELLEMNFSCILGRPRGTKSAKAINLCLFDDK
jgi:hypothetical protein